MVNQLLHQARKFTEQLKGKSSITSKDIEQAKNAISSAYANSTDAEKELLQQYQQELDALDIR
jgi:ABC-type transporter Mla subunit MlaD